eukprot:5211455-Prymnesium_polylepis.1
MLGTTVDIPPADDQPADPEPTPSSPAAGPSDAAVVTPTCARCARFDCPCTASWNGQPDQYCGDACRLGKPCSRNFHPRPRSTAARPPSGALRSSALAFAPLSLNAASPSLLSCTRCLLLFAPGVHRGDDRPLCDPCLEDARADDPNRR